MDRRLTHTKHPVRPRAVYGAIVAALCLLSAGVMQVNAAGFTVSGTVTTNSGSPVAGTTISVIDPTSGSTVATATAAADGTYSLSVAGGSYTMQAVPPSSTGFQTATYYGLNISSNSIVNFVLVPPGAVTVGGHVYDEFGIGVPNQVVALFTGNTFFHGTTDSSGSYSMQVTPGPYQIEVGQGDFAYCCSSNPAPDTVNAPDEYQLSINGNNPLTISGNTTFDFTLPEHQIHVHVQNPNGTAVTGVDLSVGEQCPSSLTVIGLPAFGCNRYLQSATQVTDANGNATLWLLSYNPYTITATPPSGNPYLPTSVAINATSDQSVTVTLQSPVTVSGHVYDEFGVGVPSQVVALFTGNTFFHGTTDSSGSYSMQVTPGPYQIEVGQGDFAYCCSFNPAPDTVNAPDEYQLSINGNNPLTISGNTTFDFTLPEHQIHVHVQNPNGTAVTGVDLSVGEQCPSSLTVIGLPAFGCNRYLQSATQVTDANGDVTLWLLSYNNYTVTATPPGNSPYLQFSFNLDATSDKTDVVVLEFIHFQPVTTATISPSPNSSGTVAGPATISMSASAASGFTVSSTTYSIDGSAAQTYTGPFTVSSLGAHSVSYYSTDSAGVQEAPKSVSFTVGPLQSSQAISFTSMPPSNAFVGGPAYTVSAAGGGSGNAVTFTIDSSAGSVCSISGSGVTFITVGTCVIDANQAGNASYLAAPQAQQSFAIGPAAQAINFTSSVPAHATYGGPTYAVAATGGGSGNDVIVTIDSSATSVCSISVATVSFTGVGLCVINANQAGNTNYDAATQVQQSFAVGQAAQTISFTSTAPASATYGGAAYTVSATGGASGNPVTLSIDTAAASVCSISGSTVTFIGAGTCAIDANQAGNSNFLAAAQTQQSFTVAKAAATVTADNQTMPFGGTVPALTYKATGLVNGDNAAVITGVACTTSATSSSAVGAYAITCSGGSAANYTISYIAGTLTIFSNPPVVGSITVPADPLALTSSTSVSASFTDTANLSALTAVWTWGDGTTSAGTFSGSTSSGTVAGTHTYAAPGVFTAILTVTNGAGQSGSATATTFVVVYDPTGGFVTGGGWINSPAGAYRGQPSLTGRANFGFVSKYQKGANVPSGNTEFQFQVAGMDFKSDAYQWLVISGSKAQYKGTGSINGVSGYGFLLTACDAEVNGSCQGVSTDTFRIKIWNTATGSVVYDNAPGPDDLTSSTEVISGGDIVIHKS